MPIDFQRQRYDFDSHTGGHRALSQSFGFPTDVIKAEAVITGFGFEFNGDDHPVHLQFANTSLAIVGPVVNVGVTFGIRDNTGNYDDPYSGFVDVVVIADRV